MQQIRHRLPPAYADFGYVLAIGFRQRFETENGQRPVKLLAGSGNWFEQLNSHATSQPTSTSSAQGSFSMSSLEEAKTTRRDKKLEEAEKVYRDKLKKACKKAINEAFINYPALPCISKGLEI